MLNKIIKDKLSSKLSGDVILTFSVQFTIMLLLFITNKILSQNLCVEDFGLFNVVKRSVAVISFVMLAGTGIALPRYSALYIGNKNNNRVKTFQITSLLFVFIVSLIIVSIGLCFQKKLSPLICNNDNELYYLAYIYAFAVSCSSFLYAYYRGLSDFKNFNYSQLIIQLALTIPLFFLKLSVKDVFSYWTFITFIIVIIYFTYEIIEKKFYNFKIHFLNLKKEIKELVVYSLPRLLGDFFLFSFTAFPLIYLKNNMDLKSVAYYSVGLTIITMATPLFSILGTILLPYVSESLAKNELKKAQVFINKLTIIYITLSILLTIFIYLLINHLIILFFSEDYILASDISKILILSIVPQSMYYLFRNPIDAVSVFPFNTIILGLSLAIIIALFYFSHTLEGYAWSYVFVSIFQGIMSFLVWKTLKKYKK